MNPWIEAMRLRTLPASVSGVIVAGGYSYYCTYGHLKWLPLILCLIFAILAQIASNFANEYYDYKAGLDRPGREGPRRGVTEGDIKPRDMVRATYLTLGLACCVGLSLIHWGGWWLILAGVIIAAGALMYSAGPYPLSRNALGEVAVFIFFGLVPVFFTCYIQTGGFDSNFFLISCPIGLMIANILVVNNYRDREDDIMVLKKTLPGILGPAKTRWLYFFNGLCAAGCASVTMDALGHGPWWLFMGVWMLLFLVVWRLMCTRTGHELNPVLGMTAMLGLLYSLEFVAYVILFT